MPGRAHRGPVRWTRRGRAWIDRLTIAGEALVFALAIAAIALVPAVLYVVNGAK